MSIETSRQEQKGLLPRSSKSVRLAAALFLTGSLAGCSSLSYLTHHEYHKPLVTLYPDIYSPFTAKDGEKLSLRLSESGAEVVKTFKAAYDVSGKATVTSKHNIGPFDFETTYADESTGQINSEIIIPQGDVQPTFNGIYFNPNYELTAERVEFTYQGEQYHLKDLTLSGLSDN